MLYEGAQGALLDIDHGTYPYVTSSNTNAANYGTNLTNFIADLRATYGSDLKFGILQLSFFDADGDGYTENQGD